MPLLARFSSKSIQFGNVVYSFWKYVSGLWKFHVLSFDFRYDLKYFRQLKIRNIHSSDVKLNKTIELQSGWPEVRADEGRVVNYTYQEVVYFGKGHNLQTGVPVRILFENGTHLDIRWGLPTEVIVSHKLRMNYHDLPPGSSVTASIMATKIDRKLDYTATLVAHYLVRWG